MTAADSGNEPIILEGLLSPRQYEILRRVSSPNKQIARELGITVGVVKNTLMLVYAKLGIFGPGKKRTRALVWALGCGLLSLEEVIEGDGRVKLEGYY